MKYFCSIPGIKEKQAVQLMIATYTKTPEYGDAAKFQQELELVILKLEKQEEDLTILNRELGLVESMMNLNMRHSLLASSSRSLISMNTTSCSSNESDCNGDGDDRDAFEDEDGDALDSLQKISNEAFSSYSFQDSEVDTLNSDGRKRLSDEWEEEFESEIVMAMYAYDGSEEGTLAMDVGDEFDVLGADVDGWTSVRRRGFVEEGFIPTAFTQSM